MNSFQLKKIIKIFIWLNIFIFSSLCLAENKITETEESLLKLKKEINQLDKNIKKNTETKDNLSNQLKKKERKISKTKKQLYNINKKFKNNKKKIKQLNKQLAKLKKEIKIKKRSLSSRLYEAYTQGNPGYLQMYLDGINPSQISRESYYIGYYSQQKNNDIESIKKAYKKIDKTKKSTNKLLKKIASLKKQKERNSKKLQKQKKEKTIVIKKINVELSSQKKKKKKLIKNEKKLNSIVSELIKKIKVESKKKTITKKIHVEKKPTPDDKFRGIDFKKLKGKLKLPVKGKITRKFNSKRKDTGTRWKGIFIKSKEGDEVRSIASGKIVFSDWLDGYGNMIIIDHGKGYMSLYGNNQSLIKQKGDIIKGGSTIAIVGNSGGNSTNGLYYQLRKNSKPFNPLKWTKLK